MDQQNPAGIAFEGKIVLIYEQGELLFGQIAKHDDSSVLVRLEREETLRLKQSRIMLISKDSYEQETDLNAFKHKLSAIPLPELTHEIFPASFGEITTKLNIDSDLPRFALFLHLKENDQLFYSKKGRYHARDEEEQNRYLGQKIEQEKRSEQLARISEYFESGQEQIGRAHV